MWVLESSTDRTTNDCVSLYPTNSPKISVQFDAFYLAHISIIATENLNDAMSALSLLTSVQVGSVEGPAHAQLRIVNTRSCSCRVQNFHLNDDRNVKGFRTVRQAADVLFAKSLPTGSRPS